MRELTDYEMANIWGGSGGGGSAAPAPDPNVGLAEVANANLSKEEFNTYMNQVFPMEQKQAQSQEQIATQQEGLQAQQQQQNIDLANQYQTRMQNTFYPIQDQVVSEANNYNTNGNFEQQAALAGGDITNQYANAKQAQAIQQEQYGINPSSGAFQGQQQKMDVQQGADTAAAMTRARNAAVQLGWAKQMDAIGVGQGLPGNQATSSSLATNQGNSVLSAGQSGIAGTQALGQGMAQGYGTAMNGNASVGQMGNQQYATQVNAWNAQQQADAQSSAGVGSALGAVAGIAVAV